MIKDECVVVKEKLNKKKSFAAHKILRHIYIKETMMEKKFFASMSSKITEIYTYFSGRFSGSIWTRIAWGISYIFSVRSRCLMGVQSHSEAFSLQASVLSERIPTPVPGALARSASQDLHSMWVFVSSSFCHSDPTVFKFGLRSLAR